MLIHILFVGSFTVVLELEDVVETEVVRVVEKRGEFVAFQRMLHLQRTKRYSQCFKLFACLDEVALFAVLPELFLRRQQLHEDFVWVLSTRQQQVLKLKPQELCALSRLMPSSSKGLDDVRNQLLLYLACEALSCREEVFINSKRLRYLLDRLEQELAAS